MELRTILKNTSYLAFSKGVALIIGIIRSKVSALTIGTLGVGIYQQMIYVSEFLSNLSQLSMNDGYVKIIAQNKQEKGFKGILSEVTVTYITLVALLTAIVVILGLIFSDKVTQYVFGDIKYILYYYISLTVMPLLILNSVSYALLKSHKAMKYISRANIIAGIAGLILFVPLILWLKITGAVISVVINYLIIFYLNNYYARTKILKSISITLKQIFNADLNIKHAKTLASFAMIGVTMGITLLVSEFICRSILIKTLGISKLGIYSPIISLTGIIQGIILPSVSTYLYPRLCEVKSNIEIRGIINDTIRLASFIIIPFLFLGVSFRYLLIPLFYSNDFIEAANYLPFHFLGSSFYIYWYIIAVILTPTGKMKTHGLFVILMAITDVAVVYFLLPRMGMFAWMLKFIISPVFFFFIYLFYLKNVYNFYIVRKNLTLMLYILFGFLIIMSFHYFNIHIPGILLYITSGLLTIGGLFFLTKYERSFIINKIKIHITKTF
jgi:O-antigen/teichoic acid export membrane protein